MNDLLHMKENNSSSENHLKDNGEIFHKGCIFVLRLLYQGHKLNAKQLVQQYNLDGRRLRDVYANRKDVKREWIVDKNGKTKFMQYYMEIPKPQTKKELTAKAEKYLQLNLL